MGDYEVESEIRKFCLIVNKEERFIKIKNSIFQSKRVIEILTELAEGEISKEDQRNYLEHLNVLKEYQARGISSLNDFNSIPEIEMCFTKFAFGFDGFEKRKKYLLEVPFLLEKRSIEIINHLINRKKHLRNNMASRLYRNLLKACKVVGIEKAFLEFDTPEEKYIDVINSLIKVQSIPDFAIFLGRYKLELSAEQIRNVFHYMQAQFEMDPIKRQRVIGLWSIVSEYQKDRSNIWYWD